MIKESLFTKTSPYPVNNHMFNSNQILVRDKHSSFQSKEPANGDTVSKVCDLMRELSSSYS